MALQKANESLPYMHGKFYGIKSNDTGEKECQPMTRKELLAREKGGGHKMPCHLYNWQKLRIHHWFETRNLLMRNSDKLSDRQRTHLLLDTFNNYEFDTDEAAALWSVLEPWIKTKDNQGKRKKNWSTAMYPDPSELPAVQLPEASAASATEDVEMSTFMETLSLPKYVTPVLSKGDAGLTAASPSETKQASYPLLPQNAASAIDALQPSNENEMPSHSAARSPKGKARVPISTPENQSRLPLSPTHRLAGEVHPVGPPASEGVPQVYYQPVSGTAPTPSHQVRHTGRATGNLRNENDRAELERQIQANRDAAMDCEKEFAGLLRRLGRL